ncbi:MAG: hypothetical protein MZV63_39080 [Marinilabiliales bacterium]|nr:hypothetical protein [Marinilabiliales bacterium]
MEGNYLLKHSINPNTRTINLVYGGSSLTEEQKEEILSHTSDFSLKGVIVKLRTGLFIIPK